MICEIVMSQLVVNLRQHGGGEIQVFWDVTSYLCVLFDDNMNC
jgi:hypothetical protein